MSEQPTQEKLARGKRIRITSGIVGLATLVIVVGLFSGSGELQGLATGTNGTNFAEEPVRDMSYAEKVCCCKAGCPDGSYFCRTMCHLLGGTCTRKASNFNGGDPTIRNSCMGATYHWWRGAQCPNTCPAHSGISP